MKLGGIFIKENENISTGIAALNHSGDVEVKFDSSEHDKIGDNFFYHLVLEVDLMYIVSFYLENDYFVLIHSSKNGYFPIKTKYLIYEIAEMKFDIFGLYLRFKPLSGIYRMFGFNLFEFRSKEDERILLKQIEY